MTASPSEQAPQTERSRSRLLRAAIWVAIGALIAAAVVSVVWVLIGSQNGIVGRAFLTILLLAAFAGVAILDSHLAERRPDWFVLVSMAGWVLTMLVGAFLIWMPERRFSVDGWGGIGRFMSFLLIVLIVQLAVLHIRLYMKAYERFRTRFTLIVTAITIGLVALLALSLVLPLMLNEWLSFHDIYWRLVVAVAILAAVGTALVPLVSALFAPKRPRRAAAFVPVPSPVPAWPTYVDGVTPLPVLPDGTPDWNAYYTGYPTFPQHYAAVPPQDAAAGQQAAWPQAAPAVPVAVAPSAPAAAPAAPAEPVAPGPAAPAEPPAAAQPAVPPQGWTAPGEPPRAPGYEGYPPAPPLPPRP